MSFMTDDDVNKRARNLFPAFESSSGITISPLIARQAPAFMGAYLALVPGAVFQAVTFDPLSAGTIVDASDNTRPAFNITQTPGTAGAITGTTAFPLNSGAVWEFEVAESVAPPDSLAYLLQFGIFGVGASAYDANSFIGSQAVPFGAGVLIDSVNPSNPLYIEFFTGGAWPLTLTPGEVYGFLMDTAGGNFYILLDGVVQFGPFPLFVLVTDALPMISVQVN